MTTTLELLVATVLSIVLAAGCRSKDELIVSDTKSVISTSGQGGASATGPSAGASGSGGSSSGGAGGMIMNGGTGGSTSGAGGTTTAGGVSGSGGTACALPQYLCRGVCALPSDPACAAKTISFDGPIVSNPTLPGTNGSTLEGASAAVDVDADGRIDWVGTYTDQSTSSCTVFALHGGGDGTFAASPLWAITKDGACNGPDHGLLAADFNGDGAIEFLVSTWVNQAPVPSTYVFGRSGGSGYDVVGTIAGVRCWWITDLTGDGHPDAICGTMGDGLTVEVSVPGAVPTFKPANQITVTASGDWGAWSASLSSTATRALLLGGASSSLLVEQPSLDALGTASAFPAMAPFGMSADLLREGRNQVILSVAESKLGVYRVDSSLSSIAPALTVDTSGGRPSVADIDGDGVPDIITSGAGVGTAVIRQTVDGKFVPAWSSTGWGDGSITTGDVNGDGLVDILTTRAQPVVLLNRTH